MPTIDADAHVVESERTWDYIDKADQKYRPLIVKPRGECGGKNVDVPTERPVDCTLLKEVQKEPSVQ
jgi:phosphoribosylamine-glycine ligase